MIWKNDTVTMNMLFEPMFCYIKNQGIMKLSYCWLLSIFIYDFTIAASCWYDQSKLSSCTSTNFAMVSKVQGLCLLSTEPATSQELLLFLVSVRALILLCACPPQPGSSATRSETEKNCFVSKSQAVLVLCFSPVSHCCQALQGRTKPCSYSHPACSL